MNKWMVPRWLAFLIAGTLIGASATAQLQVPDFLKNALPKSAPPLPAPSSLPATPGAPLPSAAQLLPRSALAATDPAATDTPQMPANAAQLFHQKGASGEELLFVLDALKNAAKHRNSRAFLLRATPAAPNSSSGIMQSLAEQGWTTLMSSYSNLAEGKSYSEKGLQHFLDATLSNKEGLRNHRVDLPAQGETMTSVQQERLLILGAMVIGTRLANETLKQAHETFVTITTQYEQLLDHRQKAATLLAGVMDRRRQALAAKNELEARKLTNGLSEDDLKFIDSFGSQVTVETFSQDVGLQNVALSYLRKTDPASYTDYVAQQKQFVSSSKAYLQTVGGVSAFGGFSALVVKQLLDMAHAKDYTGGMAALSLIRDFAKEAQPLIKNSGDALYDGLVTAPKSARRMYRIEHAGTLTDADHAPQVFQALASAGDKHYLDDAIFRDGTPGFVSHVYQCDAEHAGDLIDTAVPMAQRKQFAQNYLNWTQDGGFSFADALYDESGSPDTKRLAEPLLNRDQRKRAESLSIGEIQVQTVTKDESWNDIQLMRMILANSEGTRAQMQLGGSIVRLVPSMATIYAYESYTDTCIRSASSDSDAHDNKKLASEHDAHKTAKQH